MKWMVRDLDISEVKIRRIFREGKLKALVSITIGSDFAVHDIKIVDSGSRLLVVMPNRKDTSGRHMDIAHPISPEARQQLETAVLSGYEEKLLQQQ